MRYNNLNSDKALIFRIVHIRNVSWILAHGMHCRKSNVQAPDYFTIGNPELIEKRTDVPVPVYPGGTLGDYIPFYFTPFSPMLYSINTGYGGIRKVENRDIVFFVSSLPLLEKTGVEYVFSDRHAYLRAAKFYNNRSALHELPWADWQNRDFTRDPGDPSRFERYQAEALVCKNVPMESFQGIICYDKREADAIEVMIKEKGLEMTVHQRKRWYF